MLSDRVILAGVLFLTGAAATSLLLPFCTRALRAWGLERRNFAGEPIVTAVGLAPALATGIVALLMAWAGERSAGVDALQGVSRLPFLAEATAISALAFAVLGLIDDRWGQRGVGGLRGHLRCLLHERRVTTGLIKAVGGAAAGLAVAVAAAERGKSVPAMGVGASPAETAVGLLLAGAWIALAANAINLLDLRPLRATKGAMLLGLLVAAPALASGSSARIDALLGLALPAGSMAPYLPGEARRRVMLGDTGANALGATVATIGLFALPSPGTLAALVAVLIAFHAWTESHSLTAAIAARPWLARLDAWGWGGNDEASAKCEVRNAK